MKLKLFVRICFCLLKQPLFFLRKSKVNLSSFVGTHSLIISSQIGKYCYIGRNTIINNAEIGNYVSIASSVQIGGMEHSYWYPCQSTWVSKECVLGRTTHIGNDVWIAAGSIIKQGITIGNGAVIGANSFVAKDVPPFAIVVGSPAKILKYRFSDTVCAKIEESNYWFYRPSKAKLIIEQL